MRGREESNTNITGASVAHQLNAISMAFGWWVDDGIECWLGSFVKFQGIRTSINKKSYSLVIFFFFFFFLGGGGGLDPVPSSGSAHGIMHLSTLLRIIHDCNPLLQAQRSETCIDTTNMYLYFQRPICAENISSFKFFIDK